MHTRTHTQNTTASFESGVGGISIESSEIKDWFCGVSGVHGNVIRVTVHVDSDVQRAEI